MNNVKGKLIIISPPKINDFEYNELNFIPEYTDFIQDHETFESRRQKIIDEYEKELRNFRDIFINII